jgi:cytochrome c-type biogenesis protein
MNDTFGETILTGSLAVAVPVAALAGLVSFLSPCVLPLVPGYLGYVTGLSGAQLSTGRRWRVFVGTLLFVFGFSVIFVSYGLLFGGLGGSLREYTDVIVRLLGVVTIGLGLLFGGWLPRQYRQWVIAVRPRVGVASAPLLGAVFGLGWTPCMGPTLAAVQVLAFDEAQAGRGAVLSFAYCLGLGVPFLAAAIAYDRTMPLFGWVRRHQQVVMRAGSALLITLGIVMVTGLWSELMAAAQRWISGYEVVM